MRWRKVTEDDLPQLLDFLLPLEEACTSFTSRLRKGNGISLPSRREGVIFIARSPSSNIEGAVLLTSGGVLMPVHAPGSVFTVPETAELLSHLTAYCRSIYCLIGLSSVIQVYETALRTKIDVQIRYHLMRRERTIPLPQNIFPLDIHIHPLTDRDIKRVFPLEQDYQYEEVLVHPTQFSPTSHMAYFRRMARNQEILFATIGREPIAKAGTNAIGFTCSQIGGVFTVTRYRGHGIARSLLIRLLEDIYATDRHAVLFVKQNNDAAIRLYQKLGFSLVDEYRISYTKLD